MARTATPAARIRKVKVKAREIVEPQEPTPHDRAVFSEIAGHPFTLGMVVGLINGALAYKRDQYISLDVLGALAIPTVFAEGYLHWRSLAGLSDEERQKKRSVLYLSALTGAGLVAGAALFTRWNPSQRALLESAKATPPSAPSDVTGGGRPREVLV